METAMVNTKESNSNVSLLNFINWMYGQEVGLENLERVGTLYLRGLKALTRMVTLNEKDIQCGQFLEGLSAQLRESQTSLDLPSIEEQENIDRLAVSSGEAKSILGNLDTIQSHQLFGLKEMVGEVQLNEDDINSLIFIDELRDKLRKDISDHSN